jgi:hypothetical protein
LTSQLNIFPDLFIRRDVSSCCLKGGVKKLLVDPVCWQFKGRRRAQAQLLYNKWIRREERKQLMKDHLLDLAYCAGRGVIEAALIPVNEIEVVDQLAMICRDPGCPNYGASPGCPPNVAGPAAFRAWLKEAEAALFIKIEVPMHCRHLS